MGIQDRDWYKDMQREKEKQRQIDATRTRFAGFSKKHMRPSSRTGPGQTGLIPLILFWCVVMGLLYGLMNHYLKPKKAKVMANGDLVIARSADGHFYTQGSINGQEVKFMVDSGATLVAVTESLARKAMLASGTPATFHTANGDSAGRTVDGVAVTVGNMTVTNITVGVGLNGSVENDALLGQSFLSKFDVTMGKDALVLHPRP